MARHLAVDFFLDEKWYEEEEILAWYDLDEEIVKAGLEELVKKGGVVKKGNAYKRNTEEPVY